MVRTYKNLSCPSPKGITFSTKSLSKGWNHELLQFFNNWIWVHSNQTVLPVTDTYISWFEMCQAVHNVLNTSVHRHDQQMIRRIMIMVTATLHSQVKATICLVSLLHTTVSLKLQIQKLIWCASTRKPFQLQPYHIKLLILYAISWAESVLWSALRN